MGEAVVRVIESGRHATGETRRQLEFCLAERTGVAHVRAVQSGSAALHVALLSLGIGPGDPVLIPTYACMAVLNSVTAVGARPILVDAEPATLNLTRAGIEATLIRENLAESEIRALICPHTFGYPARLVTRESPFPIVEDAAMAIGARVDGAEVGGFGDVSIVSFYATKMVSTGHGGAILTDHSARSAKIDDLLQYDGRETYSGTSWNYSLSDIQAAMALPQLERLEEWIERRSQLAERYAEICREAEVCYHQPEPGCEPNFFRFTLFLENRQLAQSQFADRGVDTKPPVYKPLHQYLGYLDDDFPVATRLARQALSIPIYPSLSISEEERILRALTQVVSFAREVEPA